MLRGSQIRKQGPTHVEKESPQIADQAMGIIALDDEEAELDLGFL